MDQDDLVEKVGVEYTSFDVGVLYRFSKRKKIGLMLKNISGFSFKEAHDLFMLPKYATLGVSLKKGKHLYSLDCETIFGKFGGLEKKTAEFCLIRGGVEKEITGNVKVRLGLIFPVVAYTSSLGNIRNEIPWPGIGGATGIGAEFKHLKIDFALYGDPAKSYINQDIRLTASGTLIFVF